jgi:N-acetylglucosaminyl-diphospho-decaprenol L-rhamnosyltransferase
VFELSAVFVNHRTARRCAAAVASLRGCLRGEGLSGEVILVDCDSGPEDREALVAVPADRRLFLSENRGYSGGLNAGIAAAGASRLLLCNADVEFRDGALSPLLEALEQPGVGAAAPVQFADRQARIHLPSGFAAGFWRDVRQQRAQGGGRAESRRFARWAREQWRIWRRGGEVPHLTGSILATRLDVLHRAGRFDERFAFEYEETEWEDRVRRGGYRLLVVAGSTAFHFHGSSSAESPGSAARARASRDEYRRRRYGRLGKALLDRVRPRQAVVLPQFPGWEVAARGAEFILAASPNPSMLPFAGVCLESAVRLADLFVAVGPRLYLRVFRAEDGEPEEAYRADLPTP